VLARRGPTAQIEAEFRKIVANPTPPVTAELKTDESSASPAGGELHTLGYIWRVGGTASAFAFLLTTATSPDASVQVKATVTKVIGP
jgi:hypothetical protein